MNISDFNYAVAKACMDTVKRTIKVAKRLHVPVLNMHMNHGIHFTLPDKKMQWFEQYNEEYVKSFQRFRRICEEQIGTDNLRICIENTDGFRSYEKKVIEYLTQSKVFALTWDMGHLHSCGNFDKGFLLKRQNDSCIFISMML